MSRHETNRDNVKYLTWTSADIHNSYLLKASLNNTCALHRMRVSRATDHIKIPEYPYILIQCECVGSHSTYLRSFGPKGRRSSWRYRCFCMEYTQWRACLSRYIVKYRYTCSLITVSLNSFRARVSSCEQPLPSAPPTRGRRSLTGRDNASENE